MTGFAKNIGRINMKILVIVSSLLLLSGCFDNDENPVKSTQLGKATFDKNCTSCHGNAGQGLVKNWKQKQADGSFPPPPLNGTAHTWHHSPQSLLRTINDGGKQFGGQMPAFKDQLSEAEKQAVLDYIYDLWPKEIQQKYDIRFK